MRAGSHKRSFEDIEEVKQSEGEWARADAILQHASELARGPATRNGEETMDYMP